MLREIVVEEETPTDFRTTFRLCVDGIVIAENVTELETQFLISEMLERIPSPRIAAKRRRQAARKRIARREPGGDVKMAAAYEDNFGFWFLDGPEERTFFEHVKRKSLSAICMRCERSVRLMPPKTLCATCVSALEYGAPSSMNEYGYSQTRLPDPRHPPRWALLSRIRQLCPGRGDSQNKRTAAQRNSSH